MFDFDNKSVFFSLLYQFLNRYMLRIAVETSFLPALSNIHDQKVDQPQLLPVQLSFLDI